MPTGFELLVTDLEGVMLEASPHDWITFDQYPVTKDASILGMGSTRALSYAGQDLPSGIALYEMLWSGLSEAERQAIAAESASR
ncbi:hypothetical protein GCM10016455_18220 [Aliiroseovarius zhejiangensis]|uniref:HAD family phosphatase n=1 Tax=Aliiroseovarius zhejiangensis TaxID=1632025 RepID=A0ABQ3IZK0_9RHOB|nr:hypothetical protein [Aliiroseovarius zhejiangensis]GHE97937.1 hypothetical protein GCM10016455_18220 [Aliiroseovarius zhejiangensis]